MQHQFVDLLHNRLSGRNNYKAARTPHHKRVTTSIFDGVFLMTIALLLIEETEDHLDENAKLSRKTWQTLPYPKSKNKIQASSLARSTARVSIDSAG